MSDYPTPAAGGSYIRDPKTGALRPADAPAPAPAPPLEDPAADEPAAKAQERRK